MINTARRRWRLTRFVGLCVVAMLAGSLVHAHGPDLTAVERQIEKLTAGQDALRKELQPMQQQAQAPPPKQLPPPIPAELVVTGAPFKGAADAKLTIVEFSDFQCPSCALEPIHPHAFKAAEAAECAAAQNRFWEMHHRLFADQQALFPNDLVKHAQAVGLDEPQFTACLGGQMAARVQQDMAMGTQAGVNSTPTFFVGQTLPDGKVKVHGRMSGGAFPFAAFKNALDTLDRMLAEAAR